MSRACLEVPQQRPVAVDRPAPTRADVPRNVLVRFSPECPIMMYIARSTRKYVRTAIDALLSVTATMRYQKRRWEP